MKVNYPENDLRRFEGGALLPHGTKVKILKQSANLVQVETINEDDLDFVPEIHLIHPDFIKRNIDL